MIWHLKDAGVGRSGNLPEHIERRLGGAVSRFCDRVQKIVVFLRDHNGPRGGIDKVCRILVKTRGCGVVIASAIHSDWTAAVDQATARIGHLLSRQISRQATRHRTRRGESPRRSGSRTTPLLGAG